MEKKSHRVIIRKVTVEKLEKYLNMVGYKITNSNWRMIRRENGFGSCIHVGESKLTIDGKDLLGEDYSGVLEISFDNVWLEYCYGDEHMWDMVSLLFIPLSRKTKDAHSFLSFYKKESKLLKE